MQALRVFIERPVFTSMLFAAVLVFGWVTYPRIGVDDSPNVEFPVVTVLTVLPGADPETVEQDVTKKLEDALGTLSGLDTLRSESVEGMSHVVAIFNLEKPLALALQEVRDQIGANMGALPPEAQAPVVQKYDLSAAPVMTLALSGNLPIERLTDIAENQVRQSLQRRDGVGAVDVIGGRKREIRVVLNPSRLRFFNLAINDVSNALKQDSLDAPAGRTSEPKQERLVRLRAQVQSADDVRQLIVASEDGVAVRVQDVADVLDGPQQAQSMARLNHLPTVLMTVRKQSGANTVQVADALREAAQTLQKELPEGAQLSITHDGAHYIKHSIAAVQADLLWGAALAVLIVLLFLRNARSTLIAAAALPTSVVGTFVVMYLLGFTFNGITMLALTLSIGLLIDDAIVVLENIVRHVHGGTPPMQAAWLATREIAVAVLAVTLCIVSVFLPVAFMEGIIGRYFYQFGITVAAAVLISYAVSMLLTPMMAARMLVPHAQPGRFFAASERWFTALESAYARALATLLRHRGKTLAVAIVVLGCTLAMAPWIRLSFLPKTDRSALDVSLEMPLGTPLQVTLDAAEKLASQIDTYPGIKQLMTHVGGGQMQRSHKASVSVDLVPRNQRAYSQSQLQAHLRTALLPPAQSLLTVGDEHRQAGLAVNLRSANPEALMAAAESIEKAMRGNRQLVDVDSNFRLGSPSSM